MKRKKAIPEGIGEEFEPGGRPPAPGSLRVVQQFINTYNHEFEPSMDRLRTPSLARTWLIRHGVLRPQEPVMSTRDHRSLLELREALRAILSSEGEAAPRSGSIARLHDAARRARFTIEFHPEHRPRLRSTASGVGVAVGEILSAAYEAGLEGTWMRLKACRQCEWIFFDHSKNRSAEWCSMSICGNRMKNRAYRRRRSGKMGRGR